MAQKRLALAIQGACTSLQHITGHRQWLSLFSDDVRPTPPAHVPPRLKTHSLCTSHFIPQLTMFAVGSCLASAAAGCACSCCTAVTQQALRSSARAAWSILFTLSLVAAWIARDFGSTLLKELPCAHQGL
jgi:hypothetical protein